MEPDEPGTSGVATKIMPLAFPKGKEKYCELCQREAYIQCTDCQVTFYCGDVAWPDFCLLKKTKCNIEQADILRSKKYARKVQSVSTRVCRRREPEEPNYSNADHQQADWVGIHERICQMLVPIRAMKDIYDPSVRKKNQLRKTHLIKICTLVAQSKLSEGKGEEALPAAHCCLQTSIDLYGPNTIQLVPAYILLAEANMGLGNLAVVAELLSQAEWAVLKNPELGASIQQQLHRSLGQFYTTTGNLETALFHFANDIYFACEEYGLDSSATTKGYFLIADVFARQGKTLIVHSLYSEVAERWHKHLSSLLETHQKHADSSVAFYEKSQRVEMEEMLRVMLEFEQKQSRRDVNHIALIAHNLAMLWFVSGDLHKAQDFASTALQASLQIPKHKLTEPIQELLQQVESLQTEPQPGFA